MTAAIKDQFYKETVTKYAVRSDIGGLSYRCGVYCPKVFCI